MTKATITYIAPLAYLNLLKEFTERLFFWIYLFCVCGSLLYNTLLWFCNLFMLITLFCQLFFDLSMIYEFYLCILGILINLHFYSWPKHIILFVYISLVFVLFSVYCRNGLNVNILFLMRNFSNQILVYSGAVKWYNFTSILQ